MMDGKIHICFGIHDGNGKYSKYMAATMCSVLRTTNNDVAFHVLHDDSLDCNYRKVLENMVL